MQFQMVRTGRVELPFPFGSQILSLVRLPIPPRSQGMAFRIRIPRPGNFHHNRLTSKNGDAIQDILCVATFSTRLKCLNPTTVSMLPNWSEDSRCVVELWWSSPRCFTIPIETAARRQPDRLEAYSFP